MSGGAAITMTIMVTAIYLLISCLPIMHLFFSLTWNHVVVFVQVQKRLLAPLYYQSLAVPFGHCLLVGVIQAQDLRHWMYLHDVVVLWVRFCGRIGY